MMIQNGARERLDLGDAGGAPAERMPRHGSRLDAGTGGKESAGCGDGLGTISESGRTIW
jgi:hypothetical protein